MLNAVGAGRCDKGVTIGVCGTIEFRVGTASWTDQGRSTDQNSACLNLLEHDGSASPDVPKCFSQSPGKELASRVRDVFVRDVAADSGAVSVDAGRWDDHWVAIGSARPSESTYLVRTGGSFLALSGPIGPVSQGNAPADRPGREWRDERRAGLSQIRRTPSPGHENLVFYTILI
jgi:hypothetical protein